jgi:hypothetical protein
MTRPTETRELIARRQHLEWPVEDYEAVPIEEIFPTPRPRYIFLANTYYGRADAALAAIEASGWVLAPAEPTLEQCQAMYAARKLGCAAQYRAAIAARPRDGAPTAPEQEPGR